MLYFPVTVQWLPSLSTLYEPFPKDKYPFLISLSIDATTYSRCERYDNNMVIVNSTAQICRFTEYNLGTTLVFQGMSLISSVFDVSSISLALLIDSDIFSTLVEHHDSSAWLTKQVRQDCFCEGWGSYSIFVSCYKSYRSHLVMFKVTLHVPSKSRSWPPNSCKPLTMVQPSKSKDHTPS